MKRRKFFKDTGRGLASAMIFPEMMSHGRDRRLTEYEYPAVRSLEELKNEESQVAFRILIEGKSTEPGVRLKGRINIRGGTLVRIRDFFSLGKDLIDVNKGTFDLTADEGVGHILACWLDVTGNDPEMIVRAGHGSFRVSLTEAIESGETIRENDEVRLTVSGLPYHEIGVIDPGDAGIPSDRTDFRFVIMADPQGGDPEDNSNASPTRIRIHNAFIEESIDRANKLDPAALFTLVLGDFTDSQGEERNFEKMIGFYEKLQQPVLLEIGNHETKYRSVFSPGYNMAAFNNYFAAQKRVNGLEKLLYSYDLGRWHFIIWPDPLRTGFWETRPHYFDWLEKDLEKNREKPVFFFQHVPMHPIGINPLVSYVNPVHINRLMFDMLARHENVRYVFSGHVHIPIRASNKTAVDYKGMKMINLPPTGYRPRAFGEEDYYGGPSQGIAVVDVADASASVSFLTVTGRKFVYPGGFRAYDSAKDPLWFRYKWELEGNETVKNGNFEEGLDHWMHYYVYPEDRDPANLMEIRESPGRPGKSLYLFSKKRGYDAPGQDRLPQTLNQVTQVLKAPAEGQPVLRFSFRIDGAHFFPDKWNGAFLWVEGYRERHLLLSHVYVIGRGTYSIAGSYGRSVSSAYFNLNDKPNQWHDVVINTGDDFQRTSNKSLKSLKIDKYAFNFGTWTINDGYQQEIGIHIGNVAADFTFMDHIGTTRLDDKPVGLLEETDIFAARIHHEAGEHQYATQAELYPY